MKNLIFIFLMMANIALIGQNQPPLQPLQFSGNISVSQSTTITGYEAGNAIDGDILTHSETDYSDGYSDGGGVEEDTCNNNTPWWEVDLGGCVTINGVKIQSMDSLKDYYIFMSEFPFNCDKIETILADEAVTYFHVTEPLSDLEPLAFAQLPPKRYLRLQGDNPDVPIKINEISIYGTSNIKDCDFWTDLEKYGEDCDDGIDNDGDGKTDCEDWPCGVGTYYVHPVNPTCPMCDDGEICIVTTHSATQVSIDGGATFYNVTYGEKCFSNLEEGNYDIVVKTIYGCTKEEQTVLAAPPGNPTSHCENGDFENGNFQNWTGGNTQIVHGDYEFHNEDLHHQNVINANNVPSAHFSSQIGELGQYVAELGYWDANYYVDRLKYCFTVDNENKDFYFNYAFLMEHPDNSDANHGISQLPFFHWKIYNVNTPSSDIVYYKIYSDNSSLSQSETGSTRFKGWTCQNYDLSNYMGEELCIEFITGDCALGDHKCVAYIDGICGSGIMPEPIITVDKEICEFNDGDYLTINLTAEGAGYTEYYWECDVINQDGVNYLQFGTDRKTGYSSHEAFNFQNNEIECNSKIEVKFYAFNDCQSTIVNNEILYNCSEYTIDYCSPLYYCGGNNVNQVQIMGDIDCEGCTYEWESSGNGGLNRYDIKYPIVDKTHHSGAFDNTYHVTVTTPEGCIYEDYVNIKTGPQIFINNSDIIPPECEHSNGSSIVTVDLCNISTNLEDLNFIDQLTGDTYLLTFDEENSNDIHWYFYYQFDRSVDLDLILDYSNYPELTQYPYCYNEDGSTCTHEDNIFLPALPYPTPFSEPWAIKKNANPIKINPDGDNLFYHENWNLIFNNPDDPCSSIEYNAERSSIDYYQLIVYDELEQEIFRKEISAKPWETNGVDTRDVKWDYSNVPAATYEWTATIRTRCEFDTDWDSECDLAAYRTNNEIETVITEKLQIVRD